MNGCQCSRSSGVEGATRAIEWARAALGISYVEIGGAGHGATLKRARLPTGALALAPTNPTMLEIRAMVDLAQGDLAGARRVLAARTPYDLSPGWLSSR